MFDRTLLKKHADAMVSAGKGILAADESHTTMEKRFDAVDVPSTEANRCAYRSMLLSCHEGLQSSIGGVIFFEETLGQSDPKTHKSLPLLVQEAGALVGIKVDKGLAPCPEGKEGETITQGLDGLDQRLDEYRKRSAVFAKWRCVITIPPSLPSKKAYEHNAQSLARYARMCQEAGIVPIVEPEVLMDGTHPLPICYEVTETMLAYLYEALAKHDVFLEGSVLKPNMILPGSDSGESEKVSPDEIAEKTLSCLMKRVPKDVAGIAFLSGGQTELKATEHLNAINVHVGENAPWPLTFSYGRALQASSLRAWGQARGAQTVEAQAEKAQEIFCHRAKMNSLATQGKWSSEMDT